MLKKIISTVLSISLAAALVCVPHQAGAKGENSFIGSPYTVFSYNFDDSTEYTWIEKVSDETAAGGTLAKLISEVDLLEQTNGFVGKSYISFDITADELTSPFSCDLKSGAAQADENRSFFGIRLKQENDEIMLSVCGEQAAALLPGQRNTFEFCVDASEGTVGITVSNKMGTVVSKTTDIGDKNIVLKNILLAGSGDIYIDNVIMQRETFGSGSDIIFGDGSYIRTIAKAEKNSYLYFVHSHDGVISDIQVTENTLNSDYLEAYLSSDCDADDEYSSFIWDEEMTPQDAAKKIEEGNIKVCTVAMDGTLGTADDVTENTQTEISAAVPAGYSLSKAYVHIYSEDGLELTTGAGTNGIVSWMPKRSGYYTIWLYVNDGGIYVPSAKTQLFVSPKLTDKDSFIFPCEKNFYVHNGEKTLYPDENYVPLIWEGKVYLNTEYIKRLTGLEITDNAIYYLGEKKADFNPENGSITLTNGTKITAAVRNGCISFGDAAQLLGYTAVIDEEAVAVTRDTSFDFSQYTDILNDYIIKDNIEGRNYDWTGIKKPDNWDFFNWSNSSQSGTDQTAGVLYEESAAGYFTMYVGAVQSVYAGFTYNTKDIDFDGYLYEVSFDVKYSDDAANIYPRVMLQVLKNGTHQAMVNGTSVEGKVGQWTRVTSYITREQIDNAGGDEVACVVLALSPSVPGSAAGRIYFDNFTLREKSILSDATEAEITCEAFGSWHVLGETVNFRSANNRIEQFEEIKGNIYNTDNEKVYEGRISKRAFLKDGWSWTPKEPGYYEAEFYGVRSDGSESLIVNCYTSSEENSYRAYSLARRGIAVVGEKTKPMSERSDFLMLSDNASSEDRLHLADLVGFSGIRIHYVPWGNTAARKGFEPSNGTFDWTDTDVQIENVKKYGFKNVIANLIATPEWAVSADKGAGHTVVGFYKKNCYVPDDISLAGRAFGAYAQRYADTVDGIEVWNEPNYGFSAFWGDTIENFIAMTKSAYTAVKEQTNNKLDVYSAGFNGGAKYFGEVMQNAEYRKYVDAISCHGRYNAAEDFKSVLKDAGMGDIPVINSEAYNYSYFSAGVPKDFSANNMYFVMCYLMAIKDGADKLTHFEITDLYNDEKRVAVGGKYSHSMGLFRCYPYYEPHSGAVTAYNLFKNLGNNLSYIGEYDFGNGIKAVAIESDGEAQIYVWSSSDVDFKVPSQLAACIGSGTSVEDLEGKAFTGNTMKKRKVYCIKNANKTALANITQKENTALNSSFVEPYYTCVNEFGDSETNFIPMTGVFNEGALFGKNSFSADSNMLSNSKSSEWIAENNNAQDISADYTVSFDDSGMYVMVNVKDTNNYANASSGAQIIENDGIRFALDCYGNAKEVERSEYFAGMVNGVPKIYKYYAAEKYAAIIDGCTDAGSIIADSCISITRSGNTTTYKVFIPNAEMFPFVYRSGLDTDIRFALAVTDNDSGTKKGVLSFGKGLVSDTPQVWKYNILKASGVTVKASVSNNELTVSGNVYDGSDKLGIVVERVEDKKVYNLNQIEGITGGSYCASFKIESGYSYRITVMTSKKSKRVYTVYSG